jgi:hypothetical protein
MKNTFLGEYVWCDRIPRLSTGKIKKSTDLFMYSGMFSFNCHKNPLSRWLLFPLIGEEAESQEERLSSLVYQALYIVTELSQQDF